MFFSHIGYGLSARVICHAKKPGKTPMFIDMPLDDRPMMVFRRYQSVNPAAHFLDILVFLHFIHFLLPVNFHLCLSDLHSVVINQGFVRRSGIGKARYKGNIGRLPGISVVFKAYL